MFLSVLDGNLAYRYLVKPFTECLKCATHRAKRWEWCGTSALFLQGPKPYRGALCQIDPQGIELWEANPPPYPQACEDWRRWWCQHSLKKTHDQGVLVMGDGVRNCGPWDPLSLKVPLCSFGGGEGRKFFTKTDLLASNSDVNTTEWVLPALGPK